MHTSNIQSRETWRLDPLLVSQAFRRNLYFKWQQVLDWNVATVTCGSSVFGWPKAAVVNQRGIEDVRCSFANSAPGLIFCYGPSSSICDSIEFLMSWPVALIQYGAATSLPIRSLQITSTGAFEWRCVTETSPSIRGRTAFYVSSRNRSLPDSPSLTQCWWFTQEAYIVIQVRWQIRLLP